MLDERYVAEAIYAYEIDEPIRHGRLIARSRTVFSALPIIENVTTCALDRLDGLPLNPSAADDPPEPPADHKHKNNHPP